MKNRVKGRKKAVQIRKGQRKYTEREENKKAQGIIYLTW